jgi:hypothetical protein
MKVGIIILGKKEAIKSIDTIDSLDLRARYV